MRYLIRLLLVASLSLVTMFVIMGVSYLLGVEPFNIYLPFLLAMVYGLWIHNIK